MGEETLEREMEPERVDSRWATTGVSTCSWSATKEELEEEGVSDGGV